MKPPTPHDPIDDLIAAALHGDLTPQERSAFDNRLAHDPAAHAAYQEAQAMHDLLEKTHRTAQPDPDFEQRMVSAVRRKLQHVPHRETAWESLLFFWKETVDLYSSPRKFWKRTAATFLIITILGLGYAWRHDSTLLVSLRNGGIANPSWTMDTAPFYLPKAVYGLPSKSPDQREAPHRPIALLAPPAETFTSFHFTNKSQSSLETQLPTVVQSIERTKSADIGADAVGSATPAARPLRPVGDSPAKPGQAGIGFGIPSPVGHVNGNATFATDDLKRKESDASSLIGTSTSPASATANVSASWDDNWKKPESSPVDKPTPDSRKLIRNAQLDLEVKSFQAAFDQISALTKTAGGYVDTSNSQRGGNGKLQGTVVVKVLPQNLDGFLLKLRGLGDVKNQSVSTDDVTKEYFDTQARLDNSRRMETQLQDLLKRENGKVSDLLAVERELGRVRGEIEQMQGQLKLYDFQVQYATVTMNLAEKDLEQAAAYLLKEQDNFSLFAADVEGTFQKARATAESFKAQVLAANLQHNSGSDISAELDVMVAPDQIEPFLAQVRGLGRVANFTRQTQRVAQDGGDTNQPADQTLTEKDKVSVRLAIHSDDESRKQVALTVVAKTVDEALDQAKAAALANAGVEILGSSLDKTPQGQSTAQLSVRVPGREYPALLEAFRALGRPASLSIQRNDNSGPGANGDDAPVIVSLSLTDNDTPVQSTSLSILTGDPDSGAQQIKKQAAAAGVEIKTSSFERQPDGTAAAQMTLRLPMGKYAAFLETLEKTGKVESLSVQRADRPGQTEADAGAPVEIALTLHNQRAIVADNDGIWPTLRRTFGEGMSALLGSVRVIGVLVAFLAPWAFALILVAWIARRIYVSRRK